MEKNYTLLTNEYLEAGKQILANAGVQPEHAGIVMTTLLDSDLKGIYTHGFYRLKTYYKQLNRKNINANPNIRKIIESPIVQVYDADDGLGSVASFFAMQEAIDISSKSGIGVVGVRNSSHFGTAAFYAEMAAKKDKIGIVMSNASPGIAPTGSNKPLIGNNPWSISVPTNLEHPISLDIANSVVARGKIRLAALKGESIPLGWALDKEGKPTLDPKAALEGLILPIGDYKGYGIALMIEILTSILTGSYFSNQSVGIEEDGKRRNGHLFISLDIKTFLEISAFKNRLDELIHQVKNAPKLKENTEILLPGEKEWKHMLSQTMNTVKVPELIFTDMIKLCKDFQIELMPIEE